ncbi:MAG: ABC transporter permease, partial [Muribaculaceae bacterium]|nr:ABC transporter permease [Muribaculaceae bacterium]
IRADVQSRKQALNSEIGEDGTRLVDHGSPFTQSEVYTVRGSNGDPDNSGEILRMFIYAILLIVPAINLSSMTQSRLYRRISEIGVKRAFGSTRGGIVGGIITENFIVTLAGGLLGLLFCFIFGFFFSDMLFTSTGITRDMDVPLQLLLDWKLYGTALLFCFILNLLSSGIPAWRASRVDPVKALSGRA